MLRIKDPSQAPAAPPDMPPTAPPAAPPPDAGAAAPTQGDPEAVNVTPEDGGPDVTGHQVDPITAHYMGPEMGPFECERCQFWMDGGSCTLVSGQIDPEGVCNLFTPGQGHEPMDTPPEEGAPEAEAPPTEGEAPPEGQ